MPSRPLIIANWKLLQPYNAIPTWCSAHRAFLAEASTYADIVICPESIALSETARLLEGTGVHIGAQWCDAYVNGAHTGSLSPLSVLHAGGSYVLLGHAETRTRFHVTCEDVASAAASALSVGLTPIICMDDSERETQLERLSEKLRLSAPSSPGSKKIILAYEPTNFIGSDTTAQSAQIASFIGTCNNFCAQLDLACNVRYVYGGSVTPPVIPLLRELTLLDGILLGRSGVDEYMFKQIIESYAS